MTASSAIYEGWVTHRRFEPIEHSFRYPVFMPLLDVDELPGLLDRHPLWSARRPALARMRRADYLPDRPGPLAEAAREVAAEQLGESPDGPVMLLAHPRYLGVGFNPISLYYLYGSHGLPEAVVGEVTNTPWGERHAYAIRAGEDGAARTRLDKQLHVSPFMPMDQSYDWVASPPGERLSVRIGNREGGRRVFEAALALSRRPLSRVMMSRVLYAYPPMTIATLARIYWNAARLKLKGARYFRRPAGGDPREAPHGV